VARFGVFMGGVLGVVNSNGARAESFKSGGHGEESQGILDTTLESQSKITHAGIWIN